MTWRTGPRTESRLSSLDWQKYSPPRERLSRIGLTLLPHQRNGVIHEKKARALCPIAPQHRAARPLQKERAPAWTSWRAGQEYNQAGPTRSLEASISGVDWWG